MAIASTGSAGSASIRKPHVAGAFYPAEMEACRDLVRGFLDKAAPSPIPRPKVIVAPHAGFIFSGPIAGSAYANLAERAEVITRVVLIGPAHRVAFKGVAIPSADHHETPLGTVAVDWDGVRAALALPGVSVADPVFKNEHSLEVHLPFIQMTLPGASIVPLLVGDASHQDIERVLDAVWGGPETLIVISSDLSHFLDYDRARDLDSKTLAKIELMKPDGIESANACGHRPLGGALRHAIRRDLRVTALDIRNSGDTRGNKDRVVGYGAFAMEHADSARLDDATRGQLLEVARGSLEFGIKKGRAPKLEIGSNVARSALAMRACFVSLKIDGQLRGCIGSVIPHRPLVSDVMENAFKAGFGDKRFPPITPEELAKAHLEISVLSHARPMPFENEEDLARRIRPDVDGLILHEGQNRGLFLPSVWAGLPQAKLFIRNLKHKAGLSADHVLSPNARVSRFGAETFGAYVSAL